MKTATLVPSSTLTSFWCYAVLTELCCSTRIKNYFFALGSKRSEPVTFFWKDSDPLISVNVSKKQQVTLLGLYPMIDLLRVRDNLLKSKVGIRQNKIETECMFFLYQHSGIEVLDYPQLVYPTPGANSEVFYGWGGVNFFKDGKIQRGLGFFPKNPSKLKKNSQKRGFDPQNHPSDYAPASLAKWLNTRFG